MSRKTAGLGFGLAPRLAQLSRQRLSRPQDGSLYYKPQPKRREFPRRAAALPDFSATRQGGRSILLDEMNPIQEPRAYIRGKKGEPRPRHDPRFTQRAMTKDERKSWSNPYCKSFRLDGSVSLMHQRSANAVKCHPALHTHVALPAYGCALLALLHACTDRLQISSYDSLCSAFLSLQLRQTM